MAIPSSILAWQILWTGEPGGLQSIGSQRVGHDWVTNTHTGKIKQVVKEISQLGDTIMFSRVWKRFYVYSMKNSELKRKRLDGALGEPIAYKTHFKPG